MKLKCLDSENTFLLPIKNKINILVTNKYKDELIGILESYFLNKKKTKVSVKDHTGETILPKDFNFIYVPYSKDIEGNFSFKPKTTFNTEFGNVIKENSIYFLSIEKIRDSARELLTDKGMFAIMKILNHGLNNPVSINLNGFELSNILQMYHVGNDYLTEEEKYIMLYNLLLYVNRDENNIVYIDFPITEQVTSWLNTIKLDKNYIFLENESIQIKEFDQLESTAIIKLSNKDFLEEIKINKKSIINLTYIFHSFISQNINQQTQKNIELYRLFDDKNSTFLIEFDDTEYSETA